MYVPGFKNRSKKMKHSKKDHNQLTSLEECCNAIEGYFYLIEMNFILLEMEYKYDDMLKYDRRHHFLPTINENIKH